MVGILIAWFVLEAKEMSLSVLSSSVVIATGGAVLGLFQFLSRPGATREIWLYPMGLLLGFIGALAVDAIGHAVNSPEIQTEALPVAPGDPSESSWRGLSGTSPTMTASGSLFAWLGCFVTRSGGSSR